MPTHFRLFCNMTMAMTMKMKWFYCHVKVKLFPLSIQNNTRVTNIHFHMLSKQVQCEVFRGKSVPFLHGDEGRTLQWRHNGHDGVSNHQPHDCLLNRLFRRRSKKTSKLRVTSLCAGNSPGTGEFPAQMASNAKNVSIWWRHHEPVAYGP